MEREGISRSARSIVNQRLKRVVRPYSEAISGLYNASCPSRIQFPFCLETVLATLTNKLQAGGELTRDDVSLACDQLFDEAIAFSLRADFLRALHFKGESPVRNCSLC